MEAETQLDVSTATGRVLWVLRQVYGGNQRRMARHVDVSPAAVSRLVRGEQRAGPNLLKAVASNPRISREWLETGVGEPLAASAPTAPAGGRMLPVATAILPGVPSDHPHLLTGLFFPVADIYRGDMRYWLQVPADSSITSGEQWKVKQGDLLLLEADSRMWRDNAQLLDRRLCGIRLKDGPGSGCRLAEIRRNPDDGRLDYMVFAAVGTETAPIEAAGSSRILKRERTSIADTDGPPSPEERKDRSGLPIDAVVAVCLLLVRTMMSGDPSGLRGVAAGDLQVATRKKPARVVRTRHRIIDTKEGSDKTEPRQPAASATASEVAAGHQEVATPEERFRVAPPRKRIVDT
jgi:hypothetical protein